MLIFTLHRICNGVFVFRSFLSLALHNKIFYSTQVVMKTVYIWDLMHTTFILAMARFCSFKIWKPLDQLNFSVETIYFLTSSYRETKANCRHLKKLTCKRTLRLVFISIDWRDSQSCWYFRPSYVNHCPSPLLSGSTLPSFPSPPSLCEIYTYTVCGGGGWG
jgi:hypothetical protein